MKHHAIMFDLDGTLLDTLADIADAANRALTEMGRPTIELGHYRYLVGHGARWLIEQALGPQYRHLVDQGVPLFQRYYAQFGSRHTRLYDGIAELLDGLSALGLKLAVLSNKPDPATQTVVNTFLKRWRFAAVRGQKNDLPLKPDPAAALLIADQVAVPSPQWLYIGDTGVDMETARTAGMYAVGATWGFRDRQELLDDGAQTLIDHPAQLLELV